MTGGRWNGWKVEEVETEVEQDEWKGSNHVEESRGQGGDEVMDARRQSATKWRSREEWSDVQVEEGRKTDEGEEPSEEASENTLKVARGNQQHFMASVSIHINAA